MIKAILVEGIQKNIKEINEILGEGYSERFHVGDNYYALAYLVERKENCTNCGASPCGYRANHDVEDNKINKCPLWFKPKTEPKAEMPELISLGNGQYAEKHYRPFRDTDELIKVWCEHKCPAHNHRERDMTMPLIWVRYKDKHIPQKGTLIRTFFEEAVSVDEKYLSLETLFNDYEFLDGSPCGVEA